MELAEFAEKLSTWHKNQVDQLQMILDQDDATIKIQDIELVPGSDKAKGFRAGVSVALELLGTLPFSVSVDDGDEQDGDHEG